MKSKTTYNFKAGDRFHLDSIYTIQGLAGGDWWETVDGTDMGEELICTYDVKITVVVETPDPDPVDADDAL